MYICVFVLTVGVSILPLSTMFYFGIVPTVWYFGIVPTVWYFGIVPTVWYFGIAPTVWHVLFSVYYINPTQSKFTFKYKCH